MKINKYFDDKEFFIHQEDLYKSIKKHGAIPAWYISSKLIDWLTILREEFDSPLVITSGVRTPSYNTKIGGSTYSLHQYGKAVDFYIKDVSHSKVQDFIKKRWTMGGLGCAKTFTHLDVRNSNYLVTWIY